MKMEHRKETPQDLPKPSSSSPPVLSPSLSSSSSSSAVEASSSAYFSAKSTRSKTKLESRRSSSSATSSASSSLSTASLTSSSSSNSKSSLTFLFSPRQASSHNVVVPLDDPNHPNHLYDAVLQGDSGEVRRLLQDVGVDPNGRDRRGFFNFTPLSTSIALGHKDIVELLLRHGARMGKLESDDFSLVVIAVINNQSAILDVLLAHGSDVNSQTSIEIANWPTVLHGAVNLNLVPCVRVLLRHGAPIPPQLVHTAVEEGYDVLAGVLRAEEARRQCEVPALMQLSRAAVRTQLVLGGKGRLLSIESRLDVLVTQGDLPAVLKNYIMYSKY